MQYKSNFTIWYRNCPISEVDENLNEQFMRNLLKLRFLCTFLTLFLVLSLIVGGCGKKEKKEKAKQKVDHKIHDGGPISFLGGGQF